MIIKLAGEANLTQPRFIFPLFPYSMDQKALIFMSIMHKLCREEPYVIARITADKWHHVQRYKRWGHQMSTRPILEICFYSNLSSRIFRMTAYTGRLSFLKRTCMASISVEVKHWSVERYDYYTIYSCWWLFCHNSKDSSNNYEDIQDVKLICIFW